MTYIGGASHGKSRNGEAVARQLGVTPRIRGLGGRLEYWPQTPADACRRDPDPKGDASAGARLFRDTRRGRRTPAPVPDRQDVNCLLAVAARRDERGSISELAN